MKKTIYIIFFSIVLIIVSYIIYINRPKADVDIGEAKIIGYIAPGGDFNQEKAYLVNIGAITGSPTNEGNVYIDNVEPGLYQIMVSDSDGYGYSFDGDYSVSVVQGEISYFDIFNLKKGELLYLPEENQATPPPEAEQPTQPQNTPPVATITSPKKSDVKVTLKKGTTAKGTMKVKVTDADGDNMLRVELLYDNEQLYDVQTVPSADLGNGSKEYIFKITQSKGTTKEYYVRAYDVRGGVSSNSSKIKVIIQ